MPLAERLTNMRVRVKQSINEFWAVEVKYWFWPFWVEEANFPTYKSALAAADVVRNPIITEVQKT